MGELANSYKLEYLYPSTNPYVKDWQEKGKGIVGHLCNVPREIIYAAGLLPIRLLGSTDPIKDSDAYFPSVFCNYMRSFIELGIKGEYNHLEGVVATNMCDAIVHASNSMQTILNKPFFYFINRPHDTGISSSYTFYHHEINKFKQFLEEYTGENISSNSLNNAISIYNQQKELLKEIYALRGEETVPLLSGTQIATITYISQVIPPEVNVEMLSQVIKSAKTKTPAANKKPRIHVSGSILQDMNFFSLIEDCGGIVVSDDLCSGLRLFWDLIPQKDNPLEVLTNYYLEKMPCPVMHTHGVEEKKLADILTIMKHYHSDGVIFCLQKYCDPHQFDLPYLEDRLKEAGIPVLSLEVEGSTTSGQLKTRIQAFIETLES